MKFTENEWSEIIEDTGTQTNLDNNPLEQLIALSRLIRTVDKILTTDEEQLKKVVNTSHPQCSTERNRRYEQRSQEP